MIPLRLTTKIFGLFISITLMLGAVFGWFSITHEKTRMESLLDKRARTIAQNLAFNCEFGVLVGDRDQLMNLLKGVTAEGDILYASVRGKNGEVLAERVSGAFSREQVIPTKELSASVITRVKGDTLEEIADLDDSQSRTETIGEVRIGISLAEYYQEIGNSIRIIVLAILGLLVASFLLAYTGIYHFIKRPIEAITGGIREIRNGNLAHEIVVKSRDEIGDLAAAFNAMGADLSSTLVSKEYFDNIVRSMMNALLVIDGEGRIAICNRAACDLLRYREEELVGLPVPWVFKGRTLEKPGLADMMHARSITNIEKIFLTSEGGEIPVLFSSSILYDRNRRIEGLIFVAQDISERKEHERRVIAFLQKLEKSNKDLEEFAYVASHDLQEPLRKVIAFGDRLKAKCHEALTDQGRDYLDRMQNASRRMQDLINGLLVYSRVATKANPFDRVDLNQTMREVLADLEIRIEQSKGRVEVGTLPTIEADPLQMRQLLQNLTGNALKFHKPDQPPVVKINSRIVPADGLALLDEPVCPEYCEIQVEDNGIGFDSKYAEKIFGVFQRLHGRSGEYEGTGIGLSVCRKIVERHGGAITAQGVPDEGATFIIHLPLRQKQGAMDVSTPGRPDQPVTREDNPP